MIFTPVSRFSPFSSLVSPDGGQKCLFYIDERSRRCKNPIGLDGRCSARAYREKILMALQSDKLDDLLREYAVRCCCAHYHRKVVPGTRFLEQLCSRWKLELEVEDAVETVVNTDTPPQPTRTENSVESQRAARRSARTTVISLERAEELADKTTSTCAEGFRPYVQKLYGDPTYITVNKTLGSRGRETGILYLFTRPSSPGMVKIGFTTRTVQVRMNQIRRTCHYSPAVQHTISDVPHVFRVEQLVHAELSKYWRTEIKCKDNPDCPVRHQEWFEIDIDFAKTLMGKWAHWMISASPYDEMNGLLKAEWVDVCKKLRAHSQPITAQALIDELPVPSRSQLVVKAETKAAVMPDEVTETETKETKETKVVRPAASQTPLHIVPSPPPPPPLSSFLSSSLQPKDLSETITLLSAVLELLRQDLAVRQTATTTTTTQSAVIQPPLLQTADLYRSNNVLGSNLHGCPQQAIPTTA